MKKRKFLIISGLAILLIIITALTFNTFAEEKISLVYAKDNILIYSNNKMINWNEATDSNSVGQFQTSENVKKYIYYSGFLENIALPCYLTTDNKLVFTYEYFNNETYLLETQKYSIDNVVDAIYVDYPEYLVYYLSEDNKFYSYHFDDNESERKEPTLLMENVSNFTKINNTFFIKTTNNELYLLGKNTFGSGVNEGIDFINFYKLIGDVKAYNDKFVLTNSGDLYFFDSTLRKPQVIKQNVDDIITYQNNVYFYYPDNDRYYSSTGFRVFIQNADGSHSAISLCIKDSKAISYDEKLDFKVKKISNNFTLDENNNLYLINSKTRSEEIEHLDTKTFDLIDDNVKDIYALSNSYGYYLKNNGEMYFQTGSESSAPDLVKTLLKRSKYSGKYKLLSNVESIEFLNQNIITLNVGSILRFGYNDNNQFNMEMPNTYIPVKLNELNNNNAPIKPLEIILGELDRTDYSVGEEIEYSATVVPYNASSREFTWTSSDTNVVSVDAFGTMSAKSVGTATVCAVSNENEKIKSCEEVKVHPEMTGIIFENGDTIELDVNESDVLESSVVTVKILPDDTLPQDIKWTVSDGSAISLGNEYQSGPSCVTNGSSTSCSGSNYEMISVNSNQKVLRANKAGTYTLTATIGDYSATITIKAKVHANYIKISGYTKEDIYNANGIYVDMSKKKTFQLNYEVTPKEAEDKEVIFESSDEKVATIDETGKITAISPGRAWISWKLKNGRDDGGFFFYVFLADPYKQVIGDFNGDGVVDVQDLVKFRRYLAGLEESLDINENN